MYLIKFQQPATRALAKLRSRRLADDDGCVCDVRPFFSTFLALLHARERCSVWNNTTPGSACHSVFIYWPLEHCQCLPSKPLFSSNYFSRASHPLTRPLENYVNFYAPLLSLCYVFVIFIMTTSFCNLRSGAVCII